MNKKIYILIIIFTIAILGSVGYVVYAQIQTQNLGNTTGVTREWARIQGSKLVRSLTDTQGTLISNIGTTVTSSPVALEVVGSSLLDNATATNFAISDLSAGSCDVKAGTGGFLYCGTDASGGGSGSNFTNNASYLLPTTTGIGLVINSASSTITNLVVSDGLSGTGATDFFNTTLNATSTLDLTTLEVTNINHYWGSDCGAGNYVYGVNADGTLDCRADQTAGAGLGSNFLFGADQTFIYPSTTVGLIVSASTTITRLVVSDSLYGAAVTTTFNNLLNATSTLDLTTLQVTNATIDTLTLTNDLTVANGGTGASTLTGVVFGSGTSALTGTTTLSVISGGTGLQTAAAGTFLMGNGTSALIATSTLSGSAFTTAWDNMFNNTTTWGAFTTNWNALHNATSTYPGFQSQFNTALNASSTIAIASCASGQILEWSGSDWVCGTDDSGGSGSSAWQATTTPGFLNPTITPTTSNASIAVLGTATTTKLAVTEPAFGTDFIQIFHDSANAYITQNTGELILGKAGSDIFLDATTKITGNATTTGFLVVGATNPTINMAAGDVLMSRGTTTNFALTSLNAGSCDVKAGSGGYLYCGTDATAGSGLGSNWLFGADQTFIYPSTTVGLIVQASSTITTLTVTDGLYGAAVTSTWNNLFNATTTWGAFGTNWNTLHNATQTYPGFAAQFISAHNATTTYPGFQTQFNTALNATTTLDLNTFQATTVSIDTLTLTTDLTVANGGTGASTLTGVVFGTGTSALTGTTTLSVVNGGTGLQTAAANTFLMGNGTSAFVATSTLDSAAFTTAFNNLLNSTTTLDLITLQATNISGTLTGDLICTDCLNATEIEDIYVLNTSDTMSGGLTVVNSTSTASLVIPQGTSPDVDQRGEWAFDTTDNQLLISTTTGDPPRVIPTMKKLWGFTLASTSPDLVSGGRLWLPPQRDGFDVIEIHCAVDGGTSVVVGLSNSGGTTDSETVTCDADGATDTSIDTNSIYAAGSLNSVEFGTVTGVVDYVTVSIWGVFTRE